MKFLLMLLLVLSCKSRTSASLKSPIPKSIKKSEIIKPEFVDGVATFAEHNEMVLSASFSPNCSPFAALSFYEDKEWLGIWDVKNRDKKVSLPITKASKKSLKFSPNGSQVAFGGRDSKITVIEADSGDELKVLEGHKGQISVDYSRDGKWLATAGEDDKYIFIYNTRSWSIEKRFLLPGRLFDLKFSVDGSKLLVGSHHSIFLIDLKSEEQTEVVSQPKTYFSFVGFSADESAVLSAANQDNAVTMWDLKTGKEKISFAGHEDAILDAAISEDASLVATASKDKTIKIWDAVSAKLLKTLNGHKDSVSSVVFSPDGSMVLSSSPDKTVKIWDISNVK